MRILRHAIMIVRIARKMPGVWLLVLLQLMSGAASIIGLPMLVPVLQMLSENGHQAPSPLLDALSKIVISVGLEPSFYIYLWLMAIFVIISVLFDISVILFGQFRQYTLYAKSSLDLLNGYLHVHWPWMVRHNSGEINHALFIETAQWSEAIYQAVRLITASLQLGAYLVVAFVISFNAAFFALIFIGILLVVNVAISQSIKSLSYRKNLEQKSFNEFIQSIQQNRKFIKSSMMHQPLQNKFMQTISILVRYARGMATRNQAQNGLSQVGIFMVLVLLLAFHEELKFGYAELVVMMAAFARILPQVSVLSASYASFASVLPVHRALDERIALLNGEREKVGDVKVDADTKIGFGSVSFSYPNGKVVLEHADMEIPPKQTTVIIGESGEGKSTILDLLLGLWRPDNGTIQYGDIGDQQIDYATFRKQVAYVSQDTTLFPGTILENLSLGSNKIDEEKVWSVLKIVQLDKTLEKLPGGIKSLAGENGVRLSGGQRQRLAIARALLMKPKILVLDEATSALDITTEEQILDSIFSNMNHKLTMIVVTHRESLIKYADQVYLLKNGKLNLQSNLERHQESKLE